MGFFDAMLGRRKPVAPKLDALFAIPSAAMTLEVALGLHPTGVGSVAVKATDGVADDAVRQEIAPLLASGGVDDLEETHDEYGFAWFVRRAEDLPTLVTDLHVINRSFEDSGFGPSLLCSLVTFTGHVDGRDRDLALVYLYKRGTFYPFVPTGQDRRDSAFELQVRGVLANDLPIEQDVSRWFGVWGAPGL